MKAENRSVRILIGISLVFAFMTGLNGTVAGMSFLHDDTAIKGYDPVGYFKAGKAVQGNDSFTFTWHHMTWYFQNKEDLDLFAKNPEKYAPQYDGFCAWAMTEAQKARTDPEVWKIVDGRLYLNCSRASFKEWSRDIPGNIKKADRNWLRLNGKEQY